MADDMHLTYGLNVELGMLLEVLNENNEVLFRARVEEFDGDSMVISNDNGGAVPPVVYGTEYKLRGHLPGSQTAVYHGVVCGSTGHIWKLDQLTNWFTWERREFFRQNISVEAKVMRVKAIRDDDRNSFIKPEPVKCKLLDVSGGGVLLSCSESYERGDELRVGHAAIMPGSDPFSFYVMVRRVQRVRFANLYGCQFRDMNPGEQDRLIRAIFLLQRQEAKRLRGR